MSERLNRRPARRRSLAAEPALVGAVTLLVAVVAVFLSYSANDGLPFVPTYELTVEAPSAGHLVRKNAEIRMAGTRIGQVSRLEAVPNPDGPATARLHLSLDRSVEPLPVDTRFRIRPAGSLGVDLVEVVRGRSSRGFAEDAVVPSSAVLDDAVALGDLLDTFTPETRAGIRRSIAGGGYGFAGRGEGLNRAITTLDPLVADLEPVMASLGAPATRLGPFLEALRRLAGEAAPAAVEQADLVVALSRTFGALARDEDALRDAIAASPGALDAVRRDADPVDRLLRATTGLADDLRPGARALPVAARTLSGSLQAGVRGLPATERTLPRLEDVSTRLVDFGGRRPVLRSLDRLGETGRELAPLTSFVGPAQTTCSYVSLLLRNAASMLSEGPATGTAARVVLVAVDAAPDSEATLSARPSRGENPEGRSAVGPLHANPYPNTAAPGQVRECEAGQEPYLVGRQVIGNVPGNQDAVTEEVGG